MSESKEHELTAKRIARKYNTTYNRYEGADIIKNKIVIEVETEQQLIQGYSNYKDTGNLFTLQQLTKKQ